MNEQAPSTLVEAKMMTRPTWLELATRWWWLWLSVVSIGFRLLDVGIAIKTQLGCGDEFTYDLLAWNLASGNGYSFVPGHLSALSPSVVVCDNDPAQDRQVLCSAADLESWAARGASRFSSGHWLGDFPGDSCVGRGSHAAVLTRVDLA